MNIRQLAAAALLGAATAAAAQQPFDLDPSFRTTIPVDWISSILPSADGKMWISGYGWSPIAPYYSRLNHDGTGDMGAPHLNNGGFFRPWNDQFYLGADVPYRYFQDGTRDTTFNVLRSPFYHPLQGGDYLVLPDGGVLISGVHRLDDILHWPNNYYCLIRFTHTGDLDTTFQPRTCAGSLDFFTELPNGQFIGSGSTGIWDGQAASNIIRFNADGSLDPTFQANVWWGSALGFLPLPDGRVYAGGQFRIEGRQDTLNLVRFMPDGSLDPTFNNTLKFLGLNMSAMQHNLGLVRHINPLPNGRIIASGNFDHVEGQQRGCIALLDSSGTLLEDCFTGNGAGIFTNSSGSTSAGVGITPAPDGNYYIWGVYQGYDDGTTNDPTQRFVSRLYGLNVGIQEHHTGQVGQLHLAPNPCNGQAVELSLASSAGSAARDPAGGMMAQTAEVTVHDASGQVVLRGQWPAGRYTHTLKTGALAPGAYVVRVVSSDAATAGSAARDPAGGYVGRLVVMP